MFEKRPIDCYADPELAAYRAGFAAYGYPNSMRAPALDAMVRRLLEGVPVGDRMATAIPEAWLRGWDDHAARIERALAEARERIAAEPHCDKCRARVVPTGTQIGNWTDRFDGGDVLGSGLICPVPGPHMTHTVNGSPHPPISEES